MSLITVCIISSVIGACVASLVLGVFVVIKDTREKSKNFDHVASHFGEDVSTEPAVSKKIRRRFDNSDEALFAREQEKKQKGWL